MANVESLSRKVVASRLLLVALGLALSCRSSPRTDQELSPSGISGTLSAPPALAGAKPDLRPAAPRPEALASSVPHGAGPRGLPALPDVPAPKALAPLTGAPFVSLPVPGFRDAVVSLPLGATEPSPIALALHGNFDRPEWQCEVWRQITEGRVFVLCPRGIPRGDVPKSEDRWEWGSLAKTKAELVSAMSALRQRFGSHIRPGPSVFTGFSLGAILGARLIQDPELAIGAAVLTEGGYAGWTSAKAKSAASSLNALLFACGQTDCRNKVRQNLAMFEKAGLNVTVVAEVKAGHTYDGPLAEAIKKEWPLVIRSLEE